MLNSFENVLVSTSNMDSFTATQAMPHSADASGLVMPIRVSMLRLYLQQSCPTCGEDVIEDAVVHCEPGAVDLVSLLLQLRSNRRTRRTLRTVRMEHLSGLAAPGGWYTRLAEAVYQQYRLWRNAAFPMQPQTPLSIPMHITRGVPPQVAVDAGSASGAANSWG